MGIVKSKHAGNFTVLPNEIFASGLSLEAIGMLSILLSLPHNWVLRKSALPNKMKIGKEKCRRIMSELEDAGYVVSAKTVDKNGRINYEHVVYDSPFGGGKNDDLPSSENPSTVDLSTANPATYKRNSKQRNRNKETEKKMPTTKSAYQECVDLWFHVHPGWRFTGATGKAMKAIIADLERRLKMAGREGSDQEVVDLFEMILKNLPEWFRDKDLLVINSKLNEIFLSLEKRKAVSDWSNL